MTPNAGAQGAALAAPLQRLVGRQIVAHILRPYAAKSGPSPYHFIGAQEDRFGDLDADIPRSLEIDYELVT